MNYRKDKYGDELSILGFGCMRFPSKAGKIDIEETERELMTAYENVPLWHERDISHSSAERIIMPDATIALNYMLNRFGNIVKNLTVFPDNMKRNMDRTLGLIYSQRVLLALIDKGLSREEAYDTVQPKAMQAWEEQVHFRTLIEADDKITSLLSAEEIEDCFDYNYHLKNVDTIFDKVGL